MYMPIITFTRPSRLYASDGQTLKQLYQGDQATQETPLDGDIFQVFFYARGNETRLCITTMQGPYFGKWDLYINGVLDSSGYDDYAGSTGNIHRYISLTQPIRKGYNIFGLKVNGKNASSTSYTLGVKGMSIQ